MGHVIPGKRQEAVRAAKECGGFRAHFSRVAADVDAALEVVMAVLLGGHDEQMPSTVWS
jgi:hypothetical protein